MIRAVFFERLKIANLLKSCLPISCIETHRYRRGDLSFAQSYGAPNAMLAKVTVESALSITVLS